VVEKTFILDTNVLVHDPEAIFKFPRHEVCVPVTVLEELDKLKKVYGDVGRNARQAIRLLESLKKQGTGTLYTGVKLENGSQVRIEMEIKADYHKSFALTVNDNKILMAAYFLKEQGKRIVFVSKDFASRIKAQALGFEAEDYENLKYSYEGVAHGVPKIEVDKSSIDHFYKDGILKMETLEARANDYFLLSCGDQASSLARYNGRQNCLESLVKIPPLWGIKPRNIEQKCAVDALLRDDVKLVTLIGPAGTGKTLLALACAMRKVYDEGLYHKILISRPIVPLGRDIGYLPGTKEEKLTSWMQPIFDNLELLCASLGGQEPSDTLRWVQESKKIEMEAVTYIRGRSLPKMFIIIDEAQNLTPHELKTFISRAGEDSKVILTGDPTQIDNPYLDKDSNGLTYTVGRFSNHPIYANMFLEKGERSELAGLAIELL
jgi:PhoH-like ATPase